MYDGEIRNDLSKGIVITIEFDKNLLVPAHQTVKLNGPVMLYIGHYIYELRDRKGHALGHEEYWPKDMESFHHGKMVTVVVDDQHFHRAASGLPKKCTH